MEIGPKDIEKSAVMVARRDTRTKESMPMEGLADAVVSKLEEIQAALLQRARTFREEHTTRVSTYDDFKSVMEGRPGFVIAGWCGSGECEAQIKADTQATLSDTWRLNLGWQRVATPGPAEFSPPVNDLDRRRVIAYASSPSETWTLSDGGWTSQPNFDLPRSGASLAYDLARHEVVRFGGDYNGSATAETSILAGENWTVRTSPASPPA